MAMMTYGLIMVYAVLTGLGGIVQWKESGFQIRLFLFIVVSMGIIVILFIPNRDWVLIWLILAFCFIHLLAVLEGLKTKGKLTYSHHMIRFIFHCLIVLLVYKFIR